MTCNGCGRALECEAEYGRGLCRRCWPEGGVCRRCGEPAVVVYQVSEDGALIDSEPRCWTCRGER